MFSMILPSADIDEREAVEPDEEEGVGDVADPDRCEDVQKDNKRHGDDNEGGAFIARAVLRRIRGEALPEAHEGHAEGHRREDQRRD